MQGAAIFPVDEQPHENADGWKGLTFRLHLPLGGHPLGFILKEKLNLSLIECSQPPFPVLNGD